MSAMGRVLSPGGRQPVIGDGLGSDAQSGPIGRPHGVDCGPQALVPVNSFKRHDISYTNWSDDGSNHWGMRTGQPLVRETTRKQNGPHPLPVIERMSRQHTARVPQKYVNRTQSASKARTGHFANSIAREAEKQSAMNQNANALPTP